MNDEDLKEVGRAVGFVLTVAGIISLGLMALAVISLWLQSSPAR